MFWSWQLWSWHWRLSLGDWTQSLWLSPCNTTVYVSKSPFLPVRANLQWGKMTEMAWEIVVRRDKDEDENQPSHLKPTGSDGIVVKTLGSHASQDHSLHHNKAKGVTVIHMLTQPTKQQIRNNRGKCRSRGKGKRPTKTSLTTPYLNFTPQCHW